MEIRELKLFLVIWRTHLMKSIRNNLMNGYFIYNGNRTSCDMMGVFYLDKISTTWGALPKLIEIHINTLPSAGGYQYSNISDLYSFLSVTFLIFPGLLVITSVVKEFPSFWKVKNWSHMPAISYIKHFSINFKIFTYSSKWLIFLTTEVRFYLVVHSFYKLLN